MSNSAEDHTVVQPHRVPMESLAEVIDHANALRALVEWDRVGILCDEGPSAVLLVVKKDDRIVGTSRFCLTVNESVDAVRAYRTTSGAVECQTWQGETISSDQLVSLDELTGIWHASTDQSLHLERSDLAEFFHRLEDDTKKRGRGKAVSAKTSRLVCADAHGRCMFQGCGEDLTLDPVTGVRGNFATLAHNIAAAEGGTRGVLYFSEALSDEPGNILLLCDKHHRIVDTIAKADYPAHRLAAVRRSHCTAANELLDGLSNQCIPAYCVAWPIHQQAIAVPSALQIAQALAPIGARLDGQLRILGDNDEALRTAAPEVFWTIMPGHIESTADLIGMQVRGHQYRAALFAIGLMPALIALGAKLGNKCEITPMLRHREHGLWYWPAAAPQADFVKVDGIDELGDDADEIVLRLAMTADPEAMRVTEANLDLPIIRVCARNLGNASLAHPVEGFVLRQKIQELLHELRDQHGVQRVHLLPCASNAACVFFGQAFDSYHPELLLYDFVESGEAMVPRLRVYNERNKCIVASA